MITITPKASTKLAVDSIVFNGGEVHLNLDRLNHTSLNEVTINARIRSANDVMELLLATDAIRRINVSAKISLNMPYIPYARQDRVCATGDALSIKVFADIINLQKYESVTVLDSHSSVATALIDRCVEVPQFELAKYLPSSLKIDGLVSPDAGAAKKTLEFAQAMARSVSDTQPEVIYASKKRNKNGNIVATEVWAGDLSGKNLLIVDDICDGGRTFTELAGALKAKGAAEIYLFVSHGIFSAGVDVLLNKGISRILTTDSFWDGADPRVEVVRRVFDV